jgi:hypothetical protein
MRSVGAILLGNGTTGARGENTTANAIVGTTAYDSLGDGGFGADSGIVAFPNSDFVIGSPHWHRNGMENAGASTYLSGTVPFSGTISAKNSLLGASANDLIGERIRLLPGDRYAVFAPGMDEQRPGGAVADVGVVISAGTTGDVTESNAVFGVHSGSGAKMATSANAEFVVIGRPVDNEASVLRWTVLIADRIFGNGFDVH